MTDQELILAFVAKHGSITLMEAGPMMPESIRATTHVVLRNMVMDGLLIGHAASQRWTLPTRPWKGLPDTEEML